MRRNKEYLPNTEQTLLLRATLLEGSKAMDAWNQWVNIVDLDHIDPRSQRLLPLLFKNLLKHKVEDPRIGRIKGVYKLTWIRNHLLFRELTTVVQALHNENVEVMLLKGAALTLQIYNDYGKRPMSDIDIMVWNKHRFDAINIIKKLGWDPENPFKDHTLLLQALMFKNIRKDELDLHSRILHLDASKDFEIQYWERSEEFYLGDIPIKVLSHTDQLIHICLHGYRWNPFPLLRWVSDSFFIIKTGKIDWDYLVTHSRQIGASIPMSQSLIYLKSVFDLAIPELVINSLLATPSTLKERWYFWLSVAKPMPLFGELFINVVRYKLYHQEKYIFPKFLRYLQQLWSLKHWMYVPFEAILRIVQRFKIDIMGRVPEAVSKSTIFQKLN